MGVQQELELCSQLVDSTCPAPFWMMLFGFVLMGWNSLLSRVFPSPCSALTGSLQTRDWFAETSCSCLKTYVFISNEQQRFSSSTQGHAQAHTQANTWSYLLERIAWKQWCGLTSIWISLSASAIICQVIHFQVEKEGNACRASICREQGGVPSQLNPMLRVERDQTLVHSDHRSLHPGRKYWQTSYFLFSNLAGRIWQQEMLLSLQLAAMLISETI